MNFTSNSNMLAYSDRCAGHLYWQHFMIPYQRAKITTEYVSTSTNVGDNLQIIRVKTWSLLLSGIWLNLGLKVLKVCTRVNAELVRDFDMQNTPVKQESIQAVHEFLSC